MKKLTLLIFCLAVFFSGCSASVKPPEDNFTAKFSASINGIKLKGSINSVSNNTMTIKITSPKALKGYTYSYKSGRLTLTYKSLELNAEDGYLPKSDFSKMLYNVIKSLKKEDNCVLESSYNFSAEYKGNCDSGKYTLVTDKSSGLIKEISLKENKFTFKY